MKQSPSRIDHLSVLFTAMFAVIVSGQMPQTQPINPIDAASPAIEPSKKRKASSRQKREGGIGLDTLRRAQKSRPNFSKIGRELGVTPQHVRRVFLGIATSKRVMDAIQQHIEGGAK